MLLIVLLDGPAVAHLLRRQQVPLVVLLGQLAIDSSEEAAGAPSCFVRWNCC